MMLNESRVRQAIAEAFPDLNVGDVRYFAAGWDYELWQVNEDTLVRFPLREECAEPLLVEARLLSALAAHVSIRTPQPEHISEGCPSFPMPFFAYRKVPGTPLAEAGPGDEAMLSIASQVGRFVRELHSFPADRAVSLGVPAYTPEGWRAWYVAFFAKLRVRALPALEPGVARAAEAFWQAFLVDDGFFRFEPVLIHRDFDDAHMLVDGERLVGVIDFADACVGDPALDFAGCEGAFRATVLASCGVAGTLAEELSARADVYRQRISPFHALVYGVETGDSTWTERAGEAIRRWR